MNEKRCTDCKYTKGIGYDFWCGEGHTEYEVFGAETNCPYYEYHDWSKGAPSRIEKRFKADNYNFEIWDNDEFLLSFDQTVDLLNQLNDENEQLKSELNKQSEIAKNLGDFRGFITEEQVKLNNDYNSLKEENEQLKSELFFWKKQAKQCPMRSCNE